MTVSAGAFFQWTPSPEPAIAYDLTLPNAAEELIDFYGRTPPLEQVFSVAHSNSARTAIVELRYIDADFRSSHERFYAGKYRRYPSVCHRLHFFAAAFDDLALIGEHTDDYLGYSIMRPLEHSPVGRTMLKPPATLNDSVMCTVKSQPNLLGWDLEVRAVPFISQDEQLLRCAHAVQWMVLYHSYLSGETPRIHPGEIHDASGVAAPVDRTLPSHGLAPHQVLAGLDRLHLSPAIVELNFTSKKESKEERHLSLFATLCRLLNSQIPPLVHSAEHAWVVAGYRVNEPPGAHDDIELVCHDDSQGPYIHVKDPWADDYPRRPWLAAVIPYPRKVHLPAEKAEIAGRHWLTVQARAAASSTSGNYLADAVADDHVHYRTYAALAARFKSDLRSKRPDVPEELVDLYCRTQWPRFVWVVEAVDNRLRANASAQGDEGACVLGEVLFDATDHHLAAPHNVVPIALHASGRAAVRAPDYDALKELHLEQFSPYSSGCSRDLLQ